MRLIAVKMRFFEDFSEKCIYTFFMHFSRVFMNNYSVELEGDF